MIFGNTSGFENSGGVARFANKAGEAVQLQAELTCRSQNYPPPENRGFSAPDNFGPYMLILSQMRCQFLNHENRNCYIHKRG